MDVAVVERFKLEPMYIVERWLLVDWFDCIYLSFLVPNFEGRLIISKVINS